MKRKRNYKFNYIVTSIFLLFWLFLSLFLDQYTKHLADISLKYGEPYPIFGGFLNMTLVYNRGGAFGLLNNHPRFFILLSLFSFLLLIFIYMRLRRTQMHITIPFVLVLSGALGNFIDRIRFGYVVDFIDFYFSAYHWPAFNLADSIITIGIVMLVWKMWKYDNSRQRKD